jgi:hypothetical protein
MPATPRESPGHARKFTIDDGEVVRVLLDKLQTPRESRTVDEAKLMQALLHAQHGYAHSSQKVRQAFFHGVLTGYGVGLKHR